MTSDAHQNSALSPVDGTLDIRDEFRLMLLCARTRIEPEQIEQIRALSLKPLDWEFVRDKAQLHALIPLLYRNLSKHCADRVPATVLQLLEADYRENAERNRKNTSELIRVLRAFKAAHISAVPYKGPALAALAHGDIELRKFWDLDIVIQPRDILPAKELIISLGYQWHPTEGQVTGRNEARNFRVWHEYSFVYPDISPMDPDWVSAIDLHWRIAPNRFPFNVDLDDLWKRLQPARLLDEDIQTFPPEVVLLFLCVHGGKDMWWKRIGWIVDISELLASNPDLDWSYGFELAKETGARRMLLLGLALAHELLQASLPGHVLARIDSDTAVQPLVEYVRRRLFDGQAAIDYFVERQRFHIKVRERIRDRIPAYRHLLKAAFVKIFVPDDKTRELIKLPAALSVLYYLVHPARLAHRLWTHNIRRGDSTP